MNCDSTYTFLHSHNFVQTSSEQPTAKAKGQKRKHASEDSFTSTSKSRKLAEDFLNSIAESWSTSFSASILVPRESPETPTSISVSFSTSSPSARTVTSQFSLEASPKIRTHNDQNQQQRKTDSEQQQKEMKALMNLREKVKKAALLRSWHEQGRFQKNEHDRKMSIAASQCQSIQPLQQKRQSSFESFEQELEKMEYHFKRIDTNLLQAQSIEDVLSILKCNTYIDATNVAKGIHRIAYLYDNGNDTFAYNEIFFLSALAKQHIPYMKPQEFGNTAWAFNVLGMSELLKVRQ